VTGKRLLIIDDEAGIREIVSLSLKMQAGWEVLKASSGEEGIGKAELEQPDAILLDVMMPQMDGIETFRKLRANSRTQLIPVMLLTAKAQTAEKIYFESLEVSGVLTKPFNSLTLAQDIAKILKWRL
jgi:DNA-binding response OmpR family regulator